MSTVPSPQDDSSGRGHADHSNGRLDSWKDIASHLKRGVRTVIRWEQEEGLPVHRQAHQKRGTVYAYPDELDAWLATRRQSEEDTAQLGLFTESKPPSRRRAWLIGLATVAALTAAGSAAWYAGRLSQSHTPVSIAVLPFVNEGSTQSSGPLVEGLTESLIRDLSRLPGDKLKVVAYSSVRRFRNQPADVGEAARRLNVNAVLVGKVAEHEDRLFVTTELVNAGDNTQIWSARYERKPSEILAVQGEIAREIAVKLALRLDASQTKELARRASVNPDAYRNYLRGRFHWNKRTGEGTVTAINYFEKSIGSDPSYALAYAGLADAYALLSYYVPVAPGSAAPKARAAALKALAIDPGLAEAHAALAYVEGDYYWNWPASEKSFKKALDLNPEYADGHHWYGEHLSAMGRYPEALAEYRRALELDPLSLIINTNIAHAYYLSRDYDRAIEQCRQAIALDANFPNARADLGRAFLLKGMQREAITELETASRLDGGPINGHGRLGYAFAVSGRRTDALHLIDEMTRPSGQKMVPAVAIALVYVGLRNHDRAIHWLNVAAEQRSPRLALIKVDPLYDDLRPDPRFLNLLRRMNLAP